MMRAWPTRLFLFVLLACAMWLPGRAAEKPKNTGTATAVRRLGHSGGWNAYVYGDRTGRVCYLAGGPQKSEPAKFKRRMPAAMVTHRPQENVANVISFDEGTPLREGSDAALEIDGQHFDLFTKGNTAWSRTSELDKEIVEAMAKGKRAILKATPQKGPPITDIFALSGFAQAVALIDNACSVKR